MAVIMAALFWFHSGWTDQYEIAYQDTTVIVSRTELYDIRYTCVRIYEIRDTRRRVTTHICVEDRKGMT